MRQLTGVDSGFPNMENSRTIGHVAGVMISGKFSSDRAIAEYCDEIRRVGPLTVNV
jgi:glucan phosphorylase